MVTPSFNPQIPIPNNPFNNPDADRYNLSYPTGELIFGQYLLVDYVTGTVSISPNPPNNGTVTRITAGSGLDTSPISGVVTVGSIGLEVIPTLSPGPYLYSTVTVNQYGKVTFATGGSGVVTTLTGTAPIIAGGVNPNRSLGIKIATTLAPGSVQLVNSSSSSDNQKALTAQQGYIFGLELSFIGGQFGGQVFGGFVNTVTGNIAQITPGAVAKGGLSVGSPLPTPPFIPANKYDGVYFNLTATGIYTPPGGVPTPVVINDRVICINGTWQILQCGTRLTNATSSVAGVTVLATPAEVQALTEANKSVTPGALATMVASQTQVGFVKLATDAETQAFTDATRAITSSNLNNITATTSKRGLVSLSDSVADSSIAVAPTASALKQYADSLLSEALVTAKGDVIVGLSYQNPITLPVGPNSSQLVVDDTKLAQGGLDWTVPDAQTSWPLGAIIWNLAPTAPTLWLPCDGRKLDGSVGSIYYDLFSLIGTAFNIGGEGPNEFRIPDLRGKFVRGWSGSGTNPTPTALDPGRAFASTQADAYKQHNHGITDGGHIHAFSFPSHSHGVNDFGHGHGVNDTGHTHGILGIPNAEVVGNQAGFYDGNAQWAAPSDPGSLTATTNLSLASSATNVSIASCITGITQTNLCTTGVTVDNAPPSPPNPDDSRPYNYAFLPIIKYAYS